MGENHFQRFENDFLAEVALHRVQSVSDYLLPDPHRVQSVNDYLLPDPHRVKSIKEDLLPRWLQSPGTVTRYGYQV